MRTFAFLGLVVGALAFAACHRGPEDDSVASRETQEQDAQDRAWGFTRTATATHFLVENGRGSLAETNAYYTQIVDRFAPGTVTLPTWQSQFITGPTVGAFYRNKNELGFWREMTCTATIRRGVGGCMVTNWQNETDKAQHKPNQGTVAMNVSPEGFTRFYVFLPNGVLSPSALLDDEGPKFAPRLCTVCHGGSGGAPDQSPDFGSIFREFEPSLLQAQTGLSRPDAESQWFALNEAIRTANESIRGESEGGPAGVDHAKAAMSAHLDGLYPDLAPPARSLTDPALTPVSWQGNATNTALWNTVVAPYCMGCHRHNADDWADYASFDFLQGSKDGTGLLRLYTTGVNGAHPLPYMPQAELTYNRLGADHAAQAAIDAWLPCLAGQSCAPANVCHQGATVCAAGPATCRDTGLPVADGTPCGTGATCLAGACGATQCKPKVLILADTNSAGPDTVALAQAASAAGLEPTVVENGTVVFAGAELSPDFGAILVTPGRTAADDLPASGQNAIVVANARGAGVVFTEWSGFEVSQHRYAELAPLILLEYSSSRAASSGVTFTLNTDSHPIWTGLPTSFATTNLDFTIGFPVQGGVVLASVVETVDARDDPSAGVIVRDATDSGGRIVHIAHSASNVAGWTSDANTLRLSTNSLRWAARCL